MINKKLLLIFTVLLFGINIVSAYGEQYGGAGENYTVPNASVGVFTILPISAMDVAYPQELWYILFAIGGICLLLDIGFYASSNGVPVMATVISSVMGFLVFLAAAFMSPLTAKFSIVVTDTQIINVATYLFSPWVMYMCYGLSSIMLVLLFYGVLLWFKMLAKRKEEAARRESEAQFENMI